MLYKLVHPIILSNLNLYGVWEKEESNLFFPAYAFQVLVTAVLQDSSA